MHKFLLPNKKEIGIGPVMDAINDNNIEHHYFLNIKTGETEFVPGYDENAEKDLEKAEKDKDLIPIDRVETWEKYKWMEDFAKNIVRIEDEQMYEKLLIALDGKDAFGRFKKVLSSDEAWLSAWRVYERDCLFDEMKFWFNSANIDIKEEFQGFDDCPICQAMKHGLDSPGELKTAFQAAKNKGAVVGGKWFEDEESCD